MSYELDLRHVSTEELEAELASRSTVPPWVGGYPPLRPGGIHHRCPKCMRRQTNERRTQYDPPQAFVAEFPCGRHGTSGGEVKYYSAAGELLSPLG